MSDEREDAQTVFGEVPSEEDCGGTTLGGESLSVRSSGSTQAGPEQTLAYSSNPGTLTSGVKERATPIVAGYEILGELGRGAVGVVYHARQVRLNRPCALKMILAGEHTGAEAALRFLAEAEAVARLQHRNVIQIHNLGESGGLPFVELEYAPGGSLDKQLDGVPWSARAAARAVESLAQGVAEAHRSGIIHRDLKPANVLIGADGALKVADFGLAKSVGSDSGLTRTESVLGSPSYMSPEQAEGNSHLVGPAADVYSLGAILYELITGRPPFRGTNVLETLAQVKSAEPVSPSRLAPGLPRDLETITLKCLQKEAGKRYPHAADLALDLNRWLDGQPIAARPSTFWERGWKSARRRPWQAAMAAMAVILVSAMLGVWAWSYARIGEALEVARVDRLRAESAKLESDRLAASEASARAESIRGSAALALDKGVLLAESGRVGRGSLWMARAYESAAGLDEPLRRATRANLADWGRRASRPRVVVALDRGGFNLRARPDLGLAVIGSGGRPIVLDLKTLEPRITILKDQMDWKVSAVASEDGRRLVASDGKVAKAWDLATGALVGEFPRMSPLVLPDYLEVDPTGGRVAIIDYIDHKLWVWDTTGQEPLPRSVGPDVRYAHAKFSRDGRLVASIGEDGILRTWDARTLSPGFSVKVEGNHIEFLPGGVGLVVWGNGSRPKLSVWELGGTRPRFEKSIGSAITGLCCRSDGRAVLVGAHDGSIRLLDTTTGEPIAPVIQAEAPVSTINFDGSNQNLYGVRAAVCLSPDGQTVLSAHADSTARTWDVATGRPVGSVMEHPGGLAGVAFGLDGHSAITVTYGGQVIRWDLGDGPSGRPMGPRGGLDLASGQVSPDGRLVVVYGHLRPYAVIVDVATGLPRSTPLLHGGTQVSDARFSPGGKLVATGGYDATVRLWDLDGRPVGRPMATEHWVTNLAFGDGGRTLIAIDAFFNLFCWDVATGERLGSQSSLEGSIYHSLLLVSPDGKTLLTRTMRGGFWRRDARTLKTIGQEVSPAFLASLDRSDIKAVEPVAFSPDGSTLWLKEHGGLPGSMVVRRRDAATLRPVGPAVARNVEGIALVSEGRRLLTQAGTTVRLLDSTTGAEVGSAMEHPSPVRSMKISSDDSTIATGAEDGGLRFWDAATGRPIGPPRAHPGSVTDIAFLDNDRAMTFVGVPTLWEVPRPLPDNPSAIASEVRSVSMMELDTTGNGTHRLTPEAWRNLAVGSAIAVEDPEARHHRLADRFAIFGPDSAATWHLDRLLADRSDDVSALLRRSKLRDDAGNAAGSIEDQAKAEVISPGLAQAWRVWRLHDRLGRSADSLADLDQLLQVRPDESTYLAQRLSILVRLGRIADALIDLDRLVTTRPNEVSYRARRADLWVRQGRRSLALADLQVAARIRPEVFELSHRAASLALDLGDLPAYRRLCQNVLELAPANQSSSSWSNNAAWLLSLGEIADPESAVKLARSALATSPAGRERGTINTLGASLYRPGALARRSSDSTNPSGSPEARATPRTGRSSPSPTIVCTKTRRPGDGSPGFRAGPRPRPARASGPTFRS